MVADNRKGKKMTNEEKIKALKENTSAFGLMDKELQDKAREIGKKEFRFLERGLSGWNTCARDSVFCPENIFRLRPDYTEDSEVIELEVKPDRFDNALSMDTVLGGKTYYTNAPSLCPKEGYRFAGYKYELPIMDKQDCLLPTIMSNAGIVHFPTHAVYKKVEG